MSRSMKNISGAAILAACMLPAAAFAQDTTRTTRDSAGARSAAAAVRFDASQKVTVTGATIVRIDSVSSSASGASGSMGMRAPGSVGMGGTGAGMGSTGSAATGSAGSMGTAGTSGAGSATGSAGSTGTGSMTGSATAGSMGSVGSGSVGARGTMTTDSQAYGATGGKSINAIVTSGSDSLHVMLAPAEYLAAQQLTLKSGDLVNLKGVRMQMGAQAHLVASEITKGAQTVQLRDSVTGTPVWTAGAATKSDSSSMNRTMPRTDSAMTSPTRRDTTGMNRTRRDSTGMNRTGRDSTGTNRTRRDTMPTVRPAAGTRDTTTSPVRKP